MPSLFSKSYYRGNISGERYNPQKVKQLPASSVRRLSVEVARLKRMVASKIGARFRGRKVRKAMPMTRNPLYVKRKRK